MLALSPLSILGLLCSFSIFHVSLILTFVSVMWSNSYNYNSRNVTHTESPNVLVSFLIHSDIHRHICSIVFQEQNFQYLGSEQQVNDCMLVYFSRFSHENFRVHFSFSQESSFSVSATELCRFCNVSKCKQVNVYAISA